MKANIYIVIFIGFLLSVTSCTLERESFNEIYPENFFRNEDDVNKALAALYHMPFRMGYGSFYGVDEYSYQVASDFMAGTMGSRWVDATGVAQYQEHRWEENATGGYAKNFSERIYSQYNRLTSIKETIKRIEAAPITDGLKIKATAEAKCLYAWIGFILYDMFGPVPLVTDEALANPEAKILIPRLSDQEYCDIMIGYLDDAIAGGLPIRQDNDWGRVSKGMALMLKLKFHMVNRNFTEAEKVARELYGHRNSSYNLMDNYRDIFNKYNVKNKEIIHAIPCGLADGMQNRTIIQFYPVRWKQDRQCWFTFGMHWKFYDTFEPEDDRLNSVVTDYVSINGEVCNRTTGFLKEAAAIVKVDDHTYTGGEYCSVDLIVYRFADVMLSLAECINENNGTPTQEAIDLVNEVRARVNLPALTAVQTAGKEAFNKAVLNERLHEFMAEGLSRQDKIRHGVFVSDSKAQFPNSQSAEHKVRLAIPSKYILESEGVVKQNPGYTTGN
ncbi:RagB/SusD family nutrient uptake outer membrane protein [Bacteroides sp. 51]|uniref:RagB/SusD family nutrient uptake outer membrane protein n=1 Tax=Bacteroides sp. 51 TaxID=2302938 RepID=UPI0013D2781A|nr:RagB/SusD family nutrient uptake outer membrane protein [Bacteroides sp. 51]NDV81901.1 RagB/SusD family nutrient uptake outer membrane protein [Bacteroides sp. 51]